MKIIEKIEELVFGKSSISRMVMDIFKLEARLAWLSLFPLLLNLCMLFIVALTTWTILMLLISYGLFMLIGSIWLVMVAVLLLNILLLAVLIAYLVFNLKQISFERTREYLLTNVSKEHDKPEEANQKGISKHGHKNKEPTNKS